MFREIPTSNKFLQKLWTEKNLQIHQNHLKNAKSQIDQKTPPKYSHLKTKSKNLIMQDERFSQIERENRILLAKMSQPSLQFSKSLPKLGKSLNQAARKKKLVRISIENDALIKRITQKKSAYDLNKWKVDRKNIEKLLSNICEFPYSLGSTQKVFRRTSQVFTRVCAQSSVGKGKTVSNGIVYQKTIVIDGQKFDVMVQRISEYFSCRGYKIEAFSQKTLKIFAFDVGLEEAFAIMEGKENFLKLVSALQLDGDDMILVEYSELMI